MNTRLMAFVVAAVVLSAALSVAGVARAEDPPATAPVVTQRPAAPQKKTAQSEAGEPRVQTKPGDKDASDRVELGTTTVTGNRELPKVMYVVPWKKSDIGDFVGKPMNSLLDEVLAPVDRDVFRREVGYYQSLHAQPAAAPGAPAAASPQGEK